MKSSGLKSKLLFLSDIGINQNSSSLEIIRNKIINLVNVATITIILIMLVYNLFIDYFDFVKYDLIVLAAVSIAMFFCFKGKHNHSIMLITLYALIMVGGLNMGQKYQMPEIEITTVSILYLSILPTGFTMLFNSTKSRYILFLSCIFVFNFVSFQRGAPMNVTITYNLAVTLFFFISLKLISFIESTIRELDLTVREKAIAIDQLIYKNEQLEKFSYICSHDLKESVRNIGSYSSLIKHKLHHKADKIDDSYFEFIENGVMTLSKIIDNLKVYTELNRSEQLTYNQFSIYGFFEKIKFNFKNELLKGQVELITENKTKEKQLYFSNHALYLVVSNLVANALKHNSFKPALKINIVLKRESKQYILSVKDNGVGIDSDYLNMIFDPFKTILNKSSTKSAGLGLTICKQIADMTNSEIWVESQLKKGSVFYFKFHVVEHPLEKQLEKGILLAVGEEA